MGICVHCEPLWLLKIDTEGSGVCVHVCSCVFMCVCVYGVECVWCYVAMRFRIVREPVWLLKSDMGGYGVFVFVCV